MPLSPGERAVWWINNLTLSGDFAGQRFNLRPWQADGIIRPLFGTLREDGLRQYRRMFLFIPRKQGKTELTAAMGAYFLLGEGKQGQEIICAASDREQAGKLYDKVEAMILNDPYLKKQVKVYSSTKKIITKAGGNKLQVVSADGFRQHGGNPSVVLLDELHTQRNRKLYDALTSGQGTRKERLVILISTAGDDTNSLCYEEYEYACKVRDGVIQDPIYLPIIYETKPDEDWTDEAVWRKVLPGLGDFVDIEYYQEEFAKAKEVPSEESKFRTYSLNQWSAGATKWLNRDAWNRCGEETFDPESLKGRRSYWGLDLSNSFDVTALVGVFPMDDGTYRTLCHFWMPRKWADEMDRKGHTRYRSWARDPSTGLEITVRDEIDNNHIEKRIPEILADYDVQVVNTDPYRWESMSERLRLEGLPVVGFRQGWQSMSEPIKQAEILISRGDLHHNNNPVLTWMADCVVAERDARDNVTFSKKASRTGKIDGMVAMVMGLAGALADVPTEGPSILVAGR